MTNSLAILVLSCDKYADVWQPFFSFFHKYWSDCSYPIYLGTNGKVFTSDKVKQVFSNRNTTWSDELTAILNQIPEKYVLIILEDYFIYKKVSNRAIEQAIELMDTMNAAYLKLAAFPIKYDKLWPHKAIEGVNGYGEIEKGSEYRVCLQTAIWEKNSLLELLDPKEDPWQFEIEASKRSNSFNKTFLTVLSDPGINKVHGPIEYYCTAVTAGKWMRGAVELCKKEGIIIDTTNRKVESRIESFKRKLYIAMPIPFRKVVDFIQNKVRKGMQWN